MKKICSDKFFRLSAFAILLTCFCISKAASQNKTIPGELRLLYPTINNLAVEWEISGDDNLNGKVNVQYREYGTKKWKDGMPLRRVPAAENKTQLSFDPPIPNYNGFRWKNKHSGSVFDLKAGTRYEIRLSLKDPDGGNAIKTIAGKTRTIPQINASAVIKEIEPGTYDTLHTISGNAEHPVVYRSSKGKATFRHIDLRNKQWVYIDGLDVQNTSTDGIGIFLSGASDCAITYCTINAVYGIVAYLPGAFNCYISDNTLTGVSEWSNEAMGAHGKNIGEGIEMTGAANVICYNKVSNFRDCISAMEDHHAVDQVCIDIYNNDIYNGADDGVEADFCFSNCRIYRNRLTNCFVGLSSQPGLGGPTYFFRNAMYNIIHGAYKLKRNSRGDVVMHNTVVKIGTGMGGNSVMDYAYFRNNLAIGGPNLGVNWGDYGAGAPYAADIVEPGIHSDFDYDAVGVVDTAYVAKIGGKPFHQIEKHGIESLVFAAIFPNIKFPEPLRVYTTAPDLRPAAQSKVIDAGVYIPNINERFKGKAPDCGAYEQGQTLPHYGPRPRMLK